MRVDNVIFELCRSLKGNQSINNTVSASRIFTDLEKQCRTGSDIYPSNFLNFQPALVCSIKKRNEVSSNYTRLLLSDIMGGCISTVDAPPRPPPARASAPRPPKPVSKKDFTRATVGKLFAVGGAMAPFGVIHEKEKDLKRLLVKRETISDERGDRVIRFVANEGAASGTYMVEVVNSVKYPSNPKQYVTERELKEALRYHFEANAKLMRDHYPMLYEQERVHHENIVKIIDEFGPQG